ncbi:cytochrome c [Pseudomonas brassicacearum]|jgi:cytochrome c|uniref:Cytochrome c n=1 Tax=Pseudomonas mercuritolerans TaxID=2951809 RepID=A0ABT2XZ08_9PSED|nr:MULTISPECIES: cytochrome c [Pseudomonas]URM25811.1 cytochrome c [Pseudomonas frederiksbergensis]ALQ02936.1 Sulfite dehydrogenase cytochrome subunit SoxD [Pseudomonas brassicacearum]KAB0528470.1 c-type cytochrome [Pseudomonas brassicacearum subsp. brassicacearum]MCD9114805.1 cytochrome c [Pseudomonas bijieensis]MCV2223925.1 cytochrome c [Pseudomonas mercuritolerans]
MDGLKGGSFFIGLLCAFALTHASAQSQYGLGTKATEAQIASWNIDVAPDGKALPPGRATVADGEKVYMNSCVSCHGVKLEGGVGPALAGGEGTLTTDKPLKTVGSYWPYATTLFDYIRRAMPFQAPQSLSNEQVYAVTGYILHMNKLLDANATVEASTLVDVKMPNRDGFYTDDRPDSKAVACMSNCLKAH